MIRSLVLSLLFAFSASAGTFPVSTAPLSEPPASRSVPELTAGRDGYLATWIDGRSGELALLAARIAANGEVLDPTGIVLAPTSLSAPVVWTGERYLVFFAQGPNLVMRAISEDGTVGATQMVVPNALLDEMSSIDAATNGQRIVIAYAGDKLAWNIRARPHAAVLSMDGALLENYLLDETRADRLLPSVAVNDSGFFVAWNRMVLISPQLMDGFALQALRLDGRGVRLDAGPRTVGRMAAEATLRANGNAFVATSEYEGWPVSADLTQYGTPGPRPRGRFFTLNGAAAVIDQDYAPVSGWEIPLYVGVVAYDAQGRFGDPRRVLQATADGRTDVGGASAAQRGDDLLVAWLTNHSASSSPYRLFTAVASADTLAVKTEPRLLTYSAAAQRAPSVATGEHEALVAWSQDDGVYTGRITPDGRQLDGAGIKLNTNWVVHPPSAVRHDGRYAIAFAENVDDDHNNVVVRFVSPEGVLSADSVRFPTGRWEGKVTLASGGGSLVAIWGDGGLYATRIHGTTFDPPVEVVPNWAGAADPVVSFNGTHFLIAWVDTYLDWDVLYQMGISGRRMTPDLQFADAAPRELASFGYSRGHAEPALASNGSEWFLAWTHLTPTDDRKQVRIARIAADGTTDNRLGNAVARGFGAELAWTGSKLMMTWKDDAPGNPLIVAAVEDVASPRTLDPSALIYEASQASITRWRNNWVAAYPLVGGVDVGHVPRVLVTFEGRMKPKLRAIR